MRPKLALYGTYSPYEFSARRSILQRTQYCIGEMTASLSAFDAAFVEFDPSAYTPAAAFDAALVEFDPSAYTPAAAHTPGIETPRSRPPGQDGSEGLPVANTPTIHSPVPRCVMSPCTPLAAPPRAVDAVATSQKLYEAIVSVLQANGLSDKVSSKWLRQAVASRLGLGKELLENRRDEIAQLSKTALRQLGFVELKISIQEDGKTYIANLLLLDLKPEDAKVKQRVYLITISRALPPPETDVGLHGASMRMPADFRDIEGMTREQICQCVRDALDNPIDDAVAGGRLVSERLSLIKKIVVFREIVHEVHFHIAIKVTDPVRFAGAKRALQQRHKLPSHWSCTHTQFFSTVRYGVMPSQHKPCVDDDPYAWTLPHFYLVNIEHRGTRGGLDPRNRMKQS